MGDLVERLRAMYSHRGDGLPTQLVNPDGPEAADEITALRERVGALEGAAQAFLAKHDVCAPHVAEAFQHRQLRCGEYGGPNYIEELKDLRAILAQQGGGGV